MAFWKRKREPTVAPATALVRYTVFGRRDQPVTAEEAFGEILRALQAITDAPRDEVAAAMQLFQRLVAQPEHFQFFPATRDEMPQLFPDGATVAEMMQSLSDEDRAAFTQARTVCLLNYHGPPWEGHQHLEALKRVADVVGQLSEGIVFDFTALKAYGNKEWQEAVMESPALLAQNYTFVHWVNDNDMGWLHTHGMSKFACPDLELRGVPPMFEDAGLGLLMAAAQSLIERGSPAPGLRQSFGEPNVEWEFVTAEQEAEGEEHYNGPAMRLVKPGDDARDPKLTGEALFAFVGGKKAEDPTTRVEEDDREVEAAHEQAMATFPSFKGRYRQGCEGATDDDTFLVKVGFQTTSGDRENTWMSIEHWDGDKITGALVNNPEHVEGLVGGQSVTVNEPDVIDWFIIKRDRTWEGMFTDVVLMRREGLEIPERY